MSDIFEKGTRQGIRFQLPEGFTPSGLLTTEQMWKVKRDSLVPYEELLQDEVEKYGKPGRRRTSIKTSDQELTELKLAIVTHILNVKESEQSDAQLQAQKAAHNAKIDRFMAKKQDAEMENMSMEELAKLKL